MKTRTTPEEQIKISRFYEWLGKTASELALNVVQIANRNRLYQEVSALRPYHPLERHREVQCQVEVWAEENPGDPLADILREYTNSATEEAHVWRDAFPELEQDNASSSK